MTTTTDPSPAAASARRGRASWLNAVSGGFLALVLVGGLGIVLWPNDDKAPADAPAAPAVGGAAAVPGKDGIPTTAPTDVTWELVGGHAVPRSATAGPTKITGPVHAGYAHTPTGAVLAALNISTRSVFTPESGWRKVSTAQVEPGPGRTAAVKQLATVTDWTPPAVGYGQTAGFRVVSYSPTQAVIEHAVRFASTGQLQVGSITVIWRDKDWRLVLQPDGATGPYVASLPTLDGFTAFSGSI